MNILSSSVVGAGIGGGRYGGDGGVVTITGGTVTATSGTTTYASKSAGIGGSSEGDSCGDGGTVTITGGIVTATSTGSAGIGGSNGAQDAGSFSTGDSGNAVIFASSIADKSNKTNWSGVIFEGDSGSVYGSPILNSDLTFPGAAGTAAASATSLTVPSGSALTIAEDTTLAIAENGTLSNAGTVVNEGTVVNSGSISNSDLFVDFGTSPTSNISNSDSGQVVNKPQAASNLVYNGTEQALATTSSDYIQYSLDKTIWDKGLPRATNAGTYTVYYRAVNGSGQVISSELALTAAIGKASSAVATAPAALKPTYTGSEQALVAAGTATGGAMQYRVGTDGNWLEAIPTATAAGTYTVYYRVLGDFNHQDSSEQSVQAEITQAPNSWITTPSITGWTYGETAAAPVSAAKFGAVVVEYTSDGTTYSQTAPTSAGSYKARFTVAETNNYTSLSEEKSFTIAKAAPSTTLPAAKQLTYNGSEQELVSAGTATGGTMQYKLGADGTFDASVPKATRAGTYTVYYYVKGDANHEDSQESHVTVTIARKQIKKPAADPAVFTYNGLPQTYGVAGTDDYAVANSTRTEAGTQTVTVALADKANTEWTDGTSADLEFTFTIAKASPSVAITASKDKLSGGGSVTLTVDNSQLPLGAQTSVSCSDANVTVTPNGDGTFTASLPNTTKDYTFTASYSGDGNNNEASDSCAVAVTQYIPPLPSYTVPVTGEGSVAVKATVSGTTAVVGEISVKALEGAVAGGEGSEAVSTVTIDLSGMPQGVTQAQLSKSTVENLLAVVGDEGNAVESVTVNLGGAAVVVDAEALAAIAGQAEGGSVTIGVKEAKGDSLNGAQKQALSGYEVVELYFEAEVKSGGAEIHDFGGGTVSVSVAFEPVAGHDPARYVVLYVGEDGQLERYAAAWAAGMLSFTAPHFSAYAVVYVEDETQAAVDALTALPVAGELKLDGAEAAVEQAQAALDALSKLDAGQRSLVDEALVANAEEVVARGTELIEEAERAAAEAAAKKAEADAKAVAKVKNKSFSVKAGKKKVIYFKTTSSSAGTKVTFAKTKGSKYISVTKAGKVTAKKGMKKGKTYTAKVKVTCGKAYKTVKVTVHVQ
ncbi:MAG: hypothetical protein ACI36Y_06315 [Coriobacteriales bacterium]